MSAGAPLAVDAMRADVEQPWRRADRFALAALLAIALGSLPWLVHGWHECNVAVHDAAMYVLSAKALVAGDGYAYLGQPFTVRPPGVSVLIAPLIAWRGVDFLAINWSISLFGVALVAWLFALIRPRVGAWLALLVCVVVWFNPAMRRFSNQAMSDVPGAAIWIACLLVERWSSRAPSTRRELALGALIAAAMYLRTVSLLLLPAILLARAVEQLRRDRSLAGWLGFVRTRALATTLCALALIAPWIVRNQRHAPTPPVDQNYVHSYTTGIFHEDPGDPGSRRLSLGEILARVPLRGTQMLSLLGSRMRTQDATWSGERAPPGRDEVGEAIEPSTMHLVAGAALLAAASAVALLAWRASELGVLLTAAVVATYFGFQDRLVLSIFVLALPAAVELARLGLARFVARPAVDLALSLPLIALLAIDFAPRQGWDLIEARHAAHVEFAADVAGKIAADATLAASVGWHYSVFLDRPVYTLIFGIRRAGNLRGLWPIVDKYGIDTVIAMPRTPTEEQLIDTLRGRFPTQPTVHGGIVARVRD